MAAVSIEARSKDCHCRGVFTALSSVEAYKPAIGLAPASTAVAIPSGTDPPAPVPTGLVGRHHWVVALAVCALFDAAGERLIRGLWARLEDAGIGSLASHTHGHHHPHLSYAVLREWELDCVRDTLGRLPDGGRFPANVQGTVVFPRGRVALAVAVPPEVALRQDRVTSALMATGAQLHKHYHPTSWIPHVSVATRTPGALLPVAVTAISDMLPVTLTVASAALVDTATGETWPLPGIP